MRHTARTLSVSALLVVLSVGPASTPVIAAAPPAPHVAPQPTQQEAWDVYRTRLAATCAAKHLEMLPASALSDLADDFTDTLSAVQQQSIKTSVARSCRTIAGGATCDQTGFLQAAVPMGLVAPFVQRVCALPEHCTAQDHCVISH